jgi:dihydroorotase
MEFDMAKDGTIGLESAYGALMTVLPLEKVIEKLTSGKIVLASKVILLQRVPKQI